MVRSVYVFVIYRQIEGVPQWSVLHIIMWLQLVNLYDSQCLITSMSNNSIALSYNIISNVICSM